MGRRSIYTTVDEKRTAQTERNRQLTLNQDQHGLKNKKDRERQQRNRGWENSRKRMDSSSHLADVVSSTQLDNRHGDEELAEKENAMESFNVLNENISMRSPGEIANRYESGKKITETN